MKRKNVLFILFALCAFSLPIHSQRYTIEELKQGFYDQYVGKTIDTSAFQVDSLKEGCKMCILKNQAPHILCSCDLLHKEGNLRLPPSQFAWVWSKEEKGVLYRLYWISTVEAPDSEVSQKIKKQLKKKYGQLILEDGTELIPAKWFSGHIKVLSNPFVYGGEVVSKRLMKAQILDGVFLQIGEDEDPFYYDNYRDCPLEYEASSIEKIRLDGKMEVRFDGHTSREEEALRTAKGLALFARDINRCIDNSLLFSMRTKKEYSVMLYLDESTLKAHLHPLLPQELTDEDRLLLSLLSTAVEQQPAGTFKGYDSGRGFFPAIYLKANCSRGRWSFEDYRFEDVYEAMKKPKH